VLQQTRPACACGLPAWQYGQALTCCTDRMVRAMAAQRPRSAFYWLAKHPHEGSAELRAEMRALQQRLKGQRRELAHPAQSRLSAR
jgi:hypothetical protein